MSIEKLAAKKEGFNEMFCKSMLKSARFQQLIDVAEDLGLWLESDDEMIEGDQAVTFFCEETERTISWYFVDDTLTYDF